MDAKEVIGKAELPRAREADETAPNQSRKEVVSDHQGCPHVLQHRCKVTQL